MLVASFEPCAMLLFHEAGGVQRKLMKLMGILPFRDRRSLQCILFGFSLLDIISIFTYFCWQISNTPNFWEAITSFTIIGSILLTFVRFVNMRLRINRIEKLLSDLEDISFHADSPKGFEVYTETIQRTKLLSKVTLICYSNVLMAIAFVQPLLYRRLILPADPWFPVEFSGNFMKWFGHYVFQVISIVCWVLASVFVDTLPAVILVIINGQLKALGHEIKNLPVHPLGRWSDLLRFCFREYMKILRVCRQFEDIFSTVYLFQMTMLCCILCASAIALNMMSGSAQVVGALGNVVILFQIFCPCFLGNLLVANSAWFKYQLYFSRWYDLNSKQSKKGLMIFMQALEKPISIEFGRIFILNLETFTEVVKIVYKLYTLASFFTEQKA